ncbi:hypothetical protein STCU_06374 [Strigomonas culicis]|uniref:Uncharacterized protein n=1 Tax=Strigomonas culicis TaxID=28005 RepID=S9UB80_9TRYP|nr:hypothetical protein STCU_06374 [Strigomonas culicis]|eukprot:EPY25994.1 hypothetical protein STCU_06374 [Strigomonas culicis]
MTTPPANFIQWWLAKTTEERDAFLQSPETNATVVDNIQYVEAYCRAHPYRVLSEMPEALRAPERFPLSALRTPEERDRLYERPPAFFCAVPGDETAAAPPLKKRLLDGVAQRYLSPAEQQAAAAAAQEHILGVVRRFADYLLTEFERAAPPTAPAPSAEAQSRQAAAKATFLSSLCVRLLSEAGKAAVYRLQLAQGLEDQAAKRQKEAARRTKLSLQLGGTGRPSQGQGPSQADKKRERNPGGDGGKSSTEVSPVFIDLPSFGPETETVRPLGDVRAAYRALCSTWCFLAGKQLPSSSLSEETEKAEEDTEAPPENEWTVLRQHFARRLGMEQRAEKRDEWGLRRREGGEACERGHGRRRRRQSHVLPAFRGAHHYHYPRCPTLPIPKIIEEWSVATLAHRRTVEVR